MKSNGDDFIKKALKSLEEEAKPNPKQKQIMLGNLLSQMQTGEGSGKERSGLSRFGNMVTVYPWRFGFGISAIQAVLFTLMFGSNYTNFVLQLLGR
ncbi:hypothetical protein [Acetobacterium wieringae]|uniref:Uncharacterized protein n=1 Tax=Acetobacterium wieringae TaxID=52694 RepID=A0A1F2PJD5_9FIRM|nr:hypothetical protein [Acetobacterium wieringae]OFV71034.1 hypothetical protein ACWI_16200 [Acetobacterium wieringae]